MRPEPREEQNRSPSDWRPAGPPTATAGFTLAAPSSLGFAQEGRLAAEQVAALLTGHPVEIAVPILSK